MANSSTSTVDIPAADWTKSQSDEELSSDDEIVELTPHLADALASTDADDNSIFPYSPPISL